MFGGGMNNLGIIASAIQNDNGNQGLGAIGSGINDFVQDKPQQSEMSSSIDNFVKSPSQKTNWGGLAMKTLGNMKPIEEQPKKQMPAMEKITWQPIAITPQYVQTNYQQQPSYLSQRSGLYNYLMR